MGTCCVWTQEAIYEKMVPGVRFTPVRLVVKITNIKKTLF